MRFISFPLLFVAALLATGCGTSSSTVTGPSLDRCSISVSNSMSSVGASGGSGRVTIAAGRECTWSLTSSVPWITPRPVASGQGDGTVEYVVAANPDVATRRGTVVVGGQVLEVVQEGLSCRFDLQPGSHNAGAEGSSGSFTVETESGCTWTPATLDTWITITNGGSRSGSGSVNFTVAANSGGPRDGAINVGGQAFTIAQSALSCRYQLSPAAGTFGGAGGSGTVSVSAAGSCGWTATTNAAWISIVGDTNGTGNGTVSFTVQPNTGAARNGIINIGGQRFTVSQQQAACTYAISSGALALTAAGGPGTVTVSTSSGCTWTTSDVPLWVTGMPASGNGVQTITFTVEPNSGPARTAAIIIAGQVFTVSQAGGCTFSLAPGSHSATAAGGTSSFAINTAAGCIWTSSGAPAWITGVPLSGTGATTVSFTVAANPDPSPRSANINIGGQTFAVTQAAAASCSFTLNPTSHTAPAAGGASAFDVTTTPGCGWTSSGVPSWITGVPATGSGSTTINFTVAANPDPAQRTANISIGGQTFTVTQAAAASCSFTLNPTSHAATAAGGASTFVVNTAAGCTWTSSSVPSWITGVPSSGTGQTTINFTVAANTGPARNANIQIGGQTFAVSQSNGCTYVLSPGHLTFDATGAPPREFTVTTASTCPWTATASHPWIRILSGGSGPGNGTVRVDLTVNAEGTARTGNITVGGQTVTITQNP